MKITNLDKLAGSQSQSRAKTSRGPRVVVTAIIVVFLAGCGSDPSGKSPGNNSKNPNPNGKVVVGGMTEDEAREKLKVALDAWVFGDDEAKLKKDHPEIKFLDTDFVQTHKLLKYDLGAGRKFEQAGFEFAVALSFEGRAGREIKETRPFLVTKDGSQWTIMKRPG